MRLLPLPRLLRPVTAAALVASSLLLVVVEVVHPREYALDHERAQLAAIASDVTRWQVVHAVTFLVLLLAVVYLGGLAVLVARAGSRRLAVCALGLGVAGAMGLMAVDAVDGYTWGVLGEVASRPGTDQRTLELALHEVQQSGWAWTFGLLSFGLNAGLLLFAY